MPLNSLAPEAKMTGNAALSPFQRPRFAAALACVLLIPAIVYVLVFAAALTRWSGLRSLGLSKFGTVLDYGWEVRNVDADVLIFGDSSAFLGVDPRVVQATLHRRTAVLANTIGSLPITGNLVLQRYLQHNRRPAVLVLYFTPWNLNYGTSKRHDFLLEGEEELLRYGTWREIAHAVAAYPLEFLAFPFQEMESLGPEQLRRFVHHDEARREQEVRQAFGHWSYGFAFLPTSPDCLLKPEYTTPTAHNTIRQMKEQYARMGMQVVVYLAPVPDCANTAPILRASYTDVQAAKPAALPPSWFANDGFAAHILPPYVQQTSELFAGTLREALRSGQ